jgi:glutathione synthase/RimK-type ligase-like ATP-grasp enzyme
MSALTFNRGGGAIESGVSVTCGNERLPLDRLGSVWLRRPSPFRISGSVADRRVRRFCARECETLLYGALDALSVPVINRPKDELAAVRKPLQLAAADHVGFRVPRTVMTNDPDAIRNFTRQIAGPCVYKPFTPSPLRMSETRLLPAGELINESTLRHGPIIVQEHVTRGVDVRVNVFDTQVFAAEVRVTSRLADVDWRLDEAATWTSHELPEVEAERSRELVALLGLRYGCLDLRRSPEGTYYFFEINPSGQFLFVEADCGQPLAAAMAELLATAGLRD